MVAWLQFRPVYLIGSFGEVGVKTDLYVEWLRQYCQAFFFGLSVKLLPAVTVAETGCTFRVNSNSHNLQILTGKLGRLTLLSFLLGYLTCVTCTYGSVGGKWTVLDIALLLWVSLLGDLLRFLCNRKPKDAFCIVGITMIDLYPKDSWNFVFGQASLSMGETEV